MRGRATIRRTFGSLDTYNYRLYFFGQMVSVTIKSVPDLRTDTFTIVIPPINAKDDEQVRFRAVGIYSVHHTSIGGPDLVRGPLITYDSEDMVGVARTVVS